MDDDSRPSHHDEHYQVIGRIISAYNMLESWHRSLFWLCIPKQQEESAVIASLMTYDAISKAIEVLLVPAQDEGTKSAIKYFLQIASICRENRNVIAHSLSYTIPSTNMLSAFKANVRAPSLGSASMFDSDGLWEMDEAIRGAAWYGMMVFMHIWGIYGNSGKIPDFAPPVEPVPLPDRPQLPRPWNQIRVDPKLDPSQPRSSVR